MTQSLRLRVELQGYESYRLRSFLGKRKVIPGNEDRIDYLMLRTPKLTDIQ